MRTLHRYLVDHEDQLLEKVHAYAERFGYAKYASTHVEDWRLSVSGLTGAIGKEAVEMETPPPLLPEEDYASDPLCAFAIREAIRHRERGVSLTMFLGLFKYYRQAYLDLIADDPDLVSEIKTHYADTINASFSRIEMGFLQEWCSHADRDHLAELQRRNRIATNEKNMFLSLLESLRQPVILVGLDDTLLYVHWTLSELKQRPGNSYYCSIGERGPKREPDARKASEAFPWLAVDLRDFSNSDDEERTVVREVCLEEGPRFMEVSMTRMLDISDKYTGTAILMKDITEARENYSKEITQQKLASLGELAAGIAHEINTPIQYISSNLEFLGAVTRSMSGEDAEEMREAIAESMEGANKIAEIVSSMKRFAHGGECALQEANINDVITDTATISRNEWKYNAELALDLDAELPPLVCNCGEIGQLLLNLIVNAAQAVEEKFALTGDKGKIVVRSSHDDEGIHVSVSDNGIGIPEEHKEKVFELFFTTKPPGKGSGQGLSIANSVVRRHGGSIRVESEEGEGTTFTAFFPYEHDPENEREVLENLP